MARLDQPPSVEEAARTLTIPEMQEILRAVDPCAILVPSRILRRVIKQHAGVGGLGLRVPHRKTYTLAREDLLTIVDRDELDLDASVTLADRVILIAHPTVESLDTLPRERVLAKLWRLLFHARIHLELDGAISQGRLGAGEVNARIDQIGETEFEEIRSVLRQEEFLLPPRTDLTVYVEFVAVYFELRHFAPSFLRSYFPGLEEYGDVDEILKQDVDAERLLAATRLTDEMDAARLGEPLGSDRVGPPDSSPSTTTVARHGKLRVRSDRSAAALLEKANRVSGLGNLVRAAILRTRAAQLADPEVAHAARGQAHAELAALAHRLQAALTFTDSERDEWSKSLVSLLDRSARGIWTAEGRMLYDLQKVCVDHERGVYKLDVFGWAFSLGRKPIKHPLPGQRDVLVSKHLRSAAHRLLSAQLSNRARSRLAALMQSAVHRAEASLRSRFKPLIASALDKVKLLPRNIPEIVARKKLVDELLDRIVDRGFLSMGDLRDALSRNNLKLPDLTSVREFLLGDQLLRADRHLATSLDGVYRGGEVYLRWPQRLSSLAFGTPVGRFLTRYVAIPFGGSFLALEGLQHVINFAMEMVTDDVSVRLVSSGSVLGFGLFLLGLLYHRQFRAFCIEAMSRTGGVARQVLIEIPSAILRWPVIQWLVASWQFRMLQRFLVKPLIISALVAPIIAAVSDREVTLSGSLVVFAVVNLLLNTALGRNVDEFVTDWVVITWHRLRIHVFAAVYRFVMDVFNRFLESIERFLYTVDEWLRFRAGERLRATLSKAVLGFVWFFVNYVIRFCVNLLVEPQVNPIKHFPVVTVSHKVLLPLTGHLIRVLEGPLGTAWAKAIAPTAVLLAPGIFGFLVWELKENWRLYAANRPESLQPVWIGHHGETMLQLLKPGFRSGTIPKLYAKLRRASRKAYWTGQWRAPGKYLDALHHVDESIRRFVDRELLRLLRESRGWSDRSITTGEIRLTCNQILIELYCPDLGEEGMWLAFEDQSGWLVASVHRRGWFDALSEPRRQALACAMAGFYKMAGVSLVREQIQWCLGHGARGYTITDQELIIAQGADRPTYVIPLRDWQATSERQDFPALAAIERQRWVFAATPLTWRRWVVLWELDQLGASKQQVLEHVHVLPA